MRTLHSWSAACVVAAFLIIGTPQANAADVSVGADLASAYVWRGVTLNDGPVIQPSIDVAGPGYIGLNVWGNLDLDDYNDTLESGEFSEIDLTASYAIPVEGFALGIGLIEYLYPDAPEGAADAGTREVYAEAGYDIFDALSVGGFFAYDIDEVNDFYANVSTSYKMDVSEDLSMSLTGVIGFAGDDFSSGADSGAHEYNVNLSASYLAMENTELGAYVAYTDSVDDDVLIDQETDFYGGVSAYYTF